MSLSRLVPADFDEVLALNAACTPHVGEVTRTELAHLVGEATEAAVMRDEAGVTGFVIALERSASYGSPNFRWFCERYERFLYVDRIAVAARDRGLGLGRLLHDRVLAVARERSLGLVTCEVNLVPPNPASLAFHERLGFRRVGDVAHVPGEKEVTMLARDAAA
ncbi:MAG: GNAT family N-acetyltransferase [Polyangiaceae bacterium]|nr:GNAT family N-acetyltransferase [Polyangiaceae bacterium]